MSQWRWNEHPNGAMARTADGGGYNLDEITYWLHQRLVRQLDPAAISDASGRKSREAVDAAARALLLAEAPEVGGEAREEVVATVVDEIVGLGPIDPLVRDPEVSEIMVNAPNLVYFEREGKLYESPHHFRDAAHIMRVVERIIAPLGRRVDEASPMVDARLPDGSRVNVIIPPLAPDSPTLTIRKFSTERFDIGHLVRIGTLPEEMVDFLRACVVAKINIVISGGTGSGKTTLLNALSAFVPPGERIVTIEDPLELRLQQRHVVRLEARPPGIEGKGEVTQRDLFRNALRMRPDRIIVGEVRGAEAFDMLQAMNTGHEGSLTTIHANSPRDALKRLEQMVSMAGMPMTIPAIRSQIASAIRLVIQLQRLPDGKRRVVSISEITGMEGDVIQMHEIYRFVKEHTDEKGNIHGSFRATGIRPHFLTELKAYGIELPASHFDASKPL
jgi:pilus assembly protein CpaF